MGVQLPMMQWILGRQKQYKLATDEHWARLQDFASKDIENHLKRLKSKSKIIRLDCSQGILQGFTVDSKEFPDARANERIILVSTDKPNSGKTNFERCKGQVIGQNVLGVKIKLDKPILIDKKSHKDTALNYRLEYDNQDVLNRKRIIQNVLYKFKKVSCSSSIHKCLLGNYSDWSNNKFDRARVVQLERLPELDGAQTRAVEQSMMKRVLLIEGAAGTGKTLAAVNIACSMSRVRKRKILLCSPMQATVDKLARMIEDTDAGIRVVQLTSRSVNKTNQSANHSDSRSASLSVDEVRSSVQLDDLIDDAIYERRLRRAPQLPHMRTRRQEETLREHANRLVSIGSVWLRKELERDILARADIVCCTLMQAGSSCLKGINFDMLLIDDAQIATELYCLIPMMVKKIKQVTLLGDMRKEIRLARSTSKSSSGSLSLSRTSSRILDNERKSMKTKLTARQRSYTESQEMDCLFERWLSMGLSSVALKYQYRMHESLASFASYQFYQSRLRTDAEINKALTCKLDTEFLNKFNWLPNNRCLTALFDTEEDRIDETVRGLIDKLVSQGGVHHSGITVITNSPVRINESFQLVELATIEDLFGQEREFVILLCRNRQEESVFSGIDCNYLCNDYALNVALTRAKLGLFIVTDLKYVHEENCPTSSTSSLTASPNGVTKCRTYSKSWRELVKYYLANKLVDPPVEPSARLKSLYSIDS